MTPLYGWGKKSERVEYHISDVRFKRTSIISTIGLDGFSAPMTFQGTLNGDIFREYVKQVLAPTLKKGDVVVMDNLSVHKIKDVTKPILKKGAKVMYFPPYSPDLNPIELAWSKIKIMLSKLKALTIETLEKALLVALNYIHKNDIENILLTAVVR